QRHRDQDVGQEEAQERIPGRLHRRAERMTLDRERVEQAWIDASLLQRGGSLRSVELAKNDLQARVRQLGALPRRVVPLVDLSRLERETEIDLLFGCCRGVGDGLELQAG